MLFKMFKMNRDLAGTEKGEKHKQRRKHEKIHKSMKHSP